MSLFGASTPAASTAPATNLFGAKPATTGFTLGGGTAAPAGGSLFKTSTPGFSLGGSLGGTTTTTPAFSLGGTAATKPSFTLGATPAASTPAFSLGGTSATSTPAFSLGGTPAVSAAAPAFSLGATPAASAAPPAFSLGGTPAASAAPAFSLGGTTTSAASTPAFSLGSLSSTPASSLAAKPSFTLGASTTSTAPSLTLGAAPSLTLGGTTAPAAPATSYTYKQVEELINKWSIELEEQEQMFMRQANQVNQWDRLLMENAERITDLNGEVERVKADQGRLNHDLDFIASQQTELEDMLLPLEEKIKAAGVTLNNQYSDNEREKTYGLAEHIDTQLKQMSGDIKEVIEHLNVVNCTNQDENNAMYQISKILNMHMDSLVWIDQNTGTLQKKVEEVSALCDLRKREQEKNFRMAFE